MVTPALLMSGFSMAIIIACLRDFNDESPEEFMEHGYRIISGTATEDKAIKTTHHVCSAHMMKLIKGHAKRNCETNLPKSSQILMAVHFFGCLICSSTFKERKNIVGLGHFIFKSRFVDNHLMDILTEFLKHPKFHFHITSKETQDTSQRDYQEKDEELFVKTHWH